MQKIVAKLQKDKSFKKKCKYEENYCKTQTQSAKIVTLSRGQ
jgi:hypothetical protein